MSFAGCVLAFPPPLPRTWAARRPRTTGRRAWHPFLVRKLLTPMVTPLKTMPPKSRRGEAGYAPPAPPLHPVSAPRLAQQALLWRSTPRLNLIRRRVARPRLLFRALPLARATDWFFIGTNVGVLLGECMAFNVFLLYGDKVPLPGLEISPDQVALTGLGMIKRVTRLEGWIARLFPFRLNRPVHGLLPGRLAPVVGSAPRRVFSPRLASHRTPRTCAPLPVWCLCPSSAPSAAQKRAIRGRGGSLQRRPF